LKPGKTSVGTAGSQVVSPSGRKVHKLEKRKWDRSYLALDKGQTRRFLYAGGIVRHKYTTRGKASYEEKVERRTLGTGGDRLRNFVSKRYKGEREAEDETGVACELSRRLRAG
jgi:hypothetical protein